MRLHDLTADDLRDLDLIWNPIKRTVTMIEGQNDIVLASYRAGAVMERLRSAARNAAQAKQDCPLCDGFGIVELPGREDVEEHQCPVCRPWGGVRGFPGFRRSRGEVRACLLAVSTADAPWISDDEIDNAPPHIAWVVEPYAAGETPRYHPAPKQRIIAGEESF